MDFIQYPDYQGFLMQVSLHAKGHFVTITKCPVADYAGVLIFNCPD